MTIKDERKYQVMPDMPTDQFEALKVDIEARGIITPIDLDENGNILDGHHRFRACKELGISDFPTMIRPGMSEEGKRMFARKSNTMRRHLTRKQMREIIAGQLRETPQWANNLIGKELGVDGKTVKTVRESLEATSEIPKLNSFVGADGKERAALKKVKAVFAGKESVRDNILKRLSEDGALDNLDEGFFQSLDSMMTIEDSGYDPFWLRSEQECYEWLGYAHFRLGTVRPHTEKFANAWHETEWIIQRPFQNVTEWLGVEGTKFRKICGLGAELDAASFWRFYEEKKEKIIKEHADHMPKYLATRRCDREGKEIET